MFNNSTGIAAAVKFTAMTREVLLAGTYFRAVTGGGLAKGRARRVYLSCIRNLKGSKAEETRYEAKKKTLHGCCRVSKPEFV